MQHSDHGCSALEPFALQVTDDAMAPEFARGCVIVVEPSQQAQDGQYVIADYADDTWFRQYQVGDSGVTLAALNPSYRDMAVYGPLQLRGIVIAQHHRRRRKRYC